MKERIQKIIANAGVCSRRKAEELIVEGKVIVNGKRITELGYAVEPNGAKISVSGKLIHVKPVAVTILFHKPRKTMVTKNDPEERKTIYDYIPKKYHHLNPVGRLDYDSEGLLILTNDGDLAQRLTHPKFHIAKTYEVKVHPHPTPDQMQKLRDGVYIDGRKTIPAHVVLQEDNPKSSWIKLVIKEGRNRQIRRMCERVGLTVKTLVRTKIGDLTVKGIPYGKWNLLEELPANFLNNQD